MGKFLITTRIRKPFAEDFEGIFFLMGQLWSDRKLDKNELRMEFLRGLKSRNHSYLVAKKKGNVVGFVSLSIIPTLLQGSLGHIDEIIVDREHRNRGIGTALLKKILSVARKQGCEQVELESSFHRKDAHGFYVSKGFEKYAYVFFRKDIKKNKRKGMHYSVYNRINYILDRISSLM